MDRTVVIAAGGNVIVTRIGRMAEAPEHKTGAGIIRG